MADVAMPKSLLLEWEQWLASVESTIRAYKSSNLRTQNLGAFLICCGACSRYKLRKEVIKEVAKIENLIKQFYSIVHRPSPIATVSIRVTALGIEQRLKELQHYLKDEQLHTIGIWGSGGVGKTTILKALNNKFLGGDHGFHVVIYASVSQDANIARLQAPIAKQLGLPWQKKEHRETRAIHISMALEMKRFMLLLDDIWDPLNLEDIGIPLPSHQNKCKVLFTTRSKEVCTKMRANKIFKVDPLGAEDAWQLFRLYAGDVASQPKIINTAKELVKECEGLPLAVLAIGRSMASETSIDGWTDSLATIKKLKQEFNNNRLEFPLGMEPTPLSQLMLSYKKLSTDQLKHCISYCSLYPKNHFIRKEELIQYWIGEGFITGFESLEKAHQTGTELIAKLKTLGMLEDGDDPDSEVMMHDILRALLIKENEFLIQAGMGLTEVPNVQDCRGVDKVSLMYNDIQALGELPQCPRLTTLILKMNLYLKEVPNDLFALVSALRLLDLSHTGIRDIPSELCSLVQLRHLDLSFTKIKSLPKEIGRLVNLIQLLVEGTSSLATIPGGVIPNLSKLLSLNLYDSYGDWEINDSQGDGGGGGASVEELECLSQLNDLGITISNPPSLERFSSSRALTRSTRRLIVKRCKDLESMHLSSCFERLRIVTISDCGTLKDIKIGAIGDDKQGERQQQLARLEVVHLKALYQASIIWVGVCPRDFFPMLRELDISFCHELTNISWVQQLVQLEHINLDTCKKMEQVIGGGEAEAKERPDGLKRLRSLTLRNLPQLKNISEQPLSLPSLEYIKVLQCPQLRRLPLITESVIPGVIQGEKEWWNALEWKEDAAKKYPSFWYFQATV